MEISIENKGGIYGGRSVGDGSEECGLGILAEVLLGRLVRGGGMQVSVCLSSMRQAGSRQSHHRDLVVLAAWGIRPEPGGLHVGSRYPFKIQQTQHNLDNEGCVVITL